MQTMRRNLKLRLIYLPAVVGWGVAVWMRSGPLGIGLALLLAAALIFIADSARVTVTKIPSRITLEMPSSILSDTTTNYTYDAAGERTGESQGGTQVASAAYNGALVRDRGVMV